MSLRRLNGDTITDATGRISTVEEFVKLDNLFKNITIPLNSHTRILLMINAFVNSPLTFDVFLVKI